MNNLSECKDSVFFELVKQKKKNAKFYGIPFC